ncbi:MAG TPA: helix-turn-helix transcriptional regulator [Pseudonocardiaceae bacterium]|nr:helix-turn-helix transcriptional regulator [Pseudonocardiaceae bacterium]
MAKQQSINSRGIGLELQRLRKERKLTCKTVGEALDMSGSTISRIETGKREATREEVASILTLLGVVGIDRARLIDQARRQGQPDLVETAGSTEQSRNFKNFERSATRITDFELTLVPGLAQTREYAREILTTLRPGDSDDNIDEWVEQRISRSMVLSRPQPPELHWIITEMCLRQPLGSAKTMRKQVNYLLELADQPNISINIIPADVIAHVGLQGQFVILDFAAEPSIVHVEALTTGLFLDEPAKVARYRLAVEELMDVALDAKASVRLLTSIATELARE